MIDLEKTEENLGLNDSSGLIDFHSDQGKSLRVKYKNQFSIFLSMAAISLIIILGDFNFLKLLSKENTEATSKVASSEGSSLNVDSTLRSSEVTSIHNFNNTSSNKEHDTSVKKLKKSSYKSKRNKKSYFPSLSKIRDFCKKEIDKKFRYEDWRGLLKCASDLIRITDLEGRREIVNLNTQLLELFLLRAEAHHYSEKVKMKHWISWSQKLISVSIETQENAALLKEFKEKIIELERG